MMAKGMTRRTFVKMGAIAAGAAAAGGLAGCGGWTPRSQGGSNAGPEATVVEQVPEPTLIDDGLIFLTGGSFLMGSPTDEPWRGEDELQHEVAVGDFYLSPIEVTQADYLAVSGANPSLHAGDDLPVTNITWYDAIAYCNALSERAGLTPAYSFEEEGVVWDLAADGYRLPTEAEWEYACRAGTLTPFNTQTSISADDEANYYGTYPYEIEDNYFSQGGLETAPGIYRQEPIEPGSFAPNAWGLYDMHGNVSEWVWDAYGAYDPQDGTNPKGPASGNMRVCRGGGWNDFAKNLRSAYRSSVPADGSSPSLGFRVARSAAPGAGLFGAAAQVAATSGTDALIVYYSWSGNTRRVAQEIARQTGFDVVELELERPYSTDYNTVLEEAQRDQNAQARPALATTFPDMERYGTVFVGYPNWWASIPMPIATFLESYDFAGKRIMPFSSNGGGGLGQSVSAISKLAPEATVTDGLSIYYSGGSSLSSDVAAWLEANGVG